MSDEPNDNKVPDLIAVFPDRMTDHEYEILRKQFERGFPGMRVAIIDGGPKIYSLDDRIELVPILDGESLVDLLAERIENQPRAGTGGP